MRNDARDVLMLGICILQSSFHAATNSGACFSHVGIELLLFNFQIIVGDLFLCFQFEYNDCIYFLKSCARG